MPFRYTTETFVEAAKKVHGDKYDFTNSVYAGSLKPLTAVCKEHGEFTKAANQILRGLGCLKCSNVGGKLPVHKMKSLVLAKTGGSVELVQNGYFLGKDDVEFECDIHGMFVSSFNKVMKSKYHCPKCALKATGLSGRLTHAKFKDKVIRKHGDLFNLDVEEYVSASHSIFVECKKHGLFMTRPVLLYRYNCCPACIKERDEKSYTERFQETSLYLVIMESENERFLKVGVSTDVEKRIIKIKSSGYNVQVIRVIHGNCDYLYYNEQKLHNFKDLKYTPKVCFGGMYECYPHHRLKLITKVFDKIEENLPMKAPEVKHAYIDSDLILFPAANASQQMEYRYEDEDGNVICTFRDAKSAKTWYQTAEAFGCDYEFGYEGDTTKLIRKDRIIVGDFEEAVKAYEKILKRWIKESGATSYTCYISKKSGLQNFRHSVALRKPYKGNRKNSQKPYYLEELRRHVLTLPHHKKSIGQFETDDIVCGLAQRKPTNVLIQNEKDGNQCVGCWVYYPDLHEEPVWSDPKSVGVIEKHYGKLTGLGHLFLLGQIIVGDTADNYSGLDKSGLKRAYTLLSPFNDMPVDKLPEAIGVVCQAYYDKYGLAYDYVNKDGEEAVGSWKDFLVETLNLAYMRKNRNDTPEPYLSMINQWEQQNEEALL